VRVIKLLFAMLSGLALGAPAAQASESRIVLAVDGTHQPRNLPVLVAERLGYFRDAGLTVTLVDAPADPSIHQLLADGRADGVVAYYHHTFASQVEGNSTTKAVVIMGATPQLKLLVADRLRNQVRRLADLAGRKIITGGINSGKTTTMTMLAQHAGFGPSGYTRLPLGSRDDMAEALRNGEADAIVAHEPDASYILKSGAAFQLLEVTSVQGTRAALGDTYPTTALYLPAAFIAGRPAATQRLVDACLRALAWINAHDAAQIAKILPSKMVGEDPKQFIRLLDEDRLAFASDGRLSLSAAKAMLAAMTALQPKYAKVRIEDTFSNVFVDQAAGR
jgi:NitT/TauT family transport system substrate-binding protein